MSKLDEEVIWATSGTGEDFQCVDASFARELWTALEDAVNTMEAMGLHFDNPLYNRLREVLESED